jgi:uncharacterized protein (DUF1800 family)
VHLYKSNIRLLIADYEETLRTHALGHFRDLLSATLHHPAMLRYLDSDQNAAGHINENYAREIMELHTMGVGSGYSQGGVQELARILTGAGVNQSAAEPKLKPELQRQYVHSGLFEFNPNRHDYGDKLFLGRNIKGRGLAEIDEALDMISRAPATAHFISRQLAVYFVSDNPSPQLVDRMAATFRQTDGDIAAVLKAMFTSPEFKDSLGTQFKDPMHYAISAVRLAYDDKVILNVGPVLGWLGRMAEPLYGHDTPDGFPLIEAAWSAPGQMATRFEIARDRLGLGGPIQARGRRGGRSSGLSAAGQRPLLHEPASNSQCRDQGRARPGRLAAGLEHAVSVLARVHAPLVRLRSRSSGARS